MGLPKFADGAGWDYDPTPRPRWRRTMTQSDAEGEQLTKEEDVTDYHGQLLEQLRHVEDTINKFAIQNYAASGAVVLALPCR